MMTDVFAGTWELNPQRSEFDPNHRPRQGTMVFETHGDAYVVKAQGVSAKGEPVAENEQRLVPDGTPRPVPGLPGLTAVCRRRDPNAIIVEVRREDGTLAGQADYVVSPDGRSLSATTSGFDTQLRQFRQFTIWDRR
jgi:hypothetical protein